ncbi:MAG TPA: CPBP family intramembrane metalloprotease [Candidatus Saccharibacteria bacterium]|nr:CPBP family intramembrane metalloprotease [Candidatus Saccharibacteria bacterium]
MAALLWAPIFLLAVYGLVSFFYWPHKKQAEKGKINWTGWDAVGIAVFLYFAGQLIGAIVANVLPLLWGWDSERTLKWIDTNPVGQFVLILFIECITVYLLYVFLKRRKSGFGAIGLRGKPKSREVLYVLTGFAVYFFLYVVLVTLTKHFIPALDTEQQQQIGFDNAQHAALIPVFLSLVVLPPIAEELLVRGFLYSGLRKALPKIWAIVLTSGLFAIAHLQAGSGEKLLWVAAIDTFVLSVVLIHLREKTGALWAPMGLHALKNTIAFLAIFVFHVAR